MRLGFCVAIALVVSQVAAAQDIIANPGFHRQEVDAGPPHVPQLTKAPQLVQSIQPVYPEEAKAEQLTGEVTLQITIGPDGRVSDALVTTPAGHGFDEAALAAVKQFAFSPAEIDGQPASVRISYTQHFVYAAPPPPPPLDGGAIALPVIPISITGKILERATRKPIANAAITTQPVTSVDPVLTGPDGSFELRVAPGQVMVMVQEGAHYAFNTVETLKPAERLQVTYYMMPKSYGLYETVVHGEREAKEVSRYTLEGDELQKVPGSFGDPLRVITDLPGVARPPFGLGLLVVEGANPADTGTYMDGIQLPLLYHFLAGPSVINPEFLDRIDFYPGGFGAEYGRAIGGIIDVDTHAPKEEWHGSAKVDLLDADFYLQAPIVEGLTISAAARRSYVDAVLAAFLPLISSNAPTVAPSYYDYQLRLDYKPPHTNQQWGLFFFGSDDLLDVVDNGGGATVSVNEHMGFQRLAASWGWHDGTLKVSVKPFVGADETSVGFDTEQLDETSDVGGVRETTEWQPSKVFTLRAGLDFELDKNSVSAYFAAPASNYVLFPGASNDVPLQKITESIDEYDYGVWTEGIITLPKGLKLIPGLRADEFRYSGIWRPEVDPRLVIRQDFTIFGSLASAWKASVGEYHEAAPAQDLVPTLGNPDIGLQGAIQSSLGIEQHFTDSLHVELTGFYNRRYDLAVGVNEVITNPDGTLTRVRLDNEGLGRAYGLMVLLKQEITQHFFGWLAYTLSWSEQKSPGQPDYVPTEYDQRHNLIAVAQYKFGNGWELGGKFQLTTGSPTTIPIGATLSTDTGSYSPIDGPTNGARLPTFQELDLRLDRDFYFDRWMLGVYLDVLNVYNATNEEAVIYDYRYRTSTPVPGIPFFPTLGIKGSF